MTFFGAVLGAGGFRRVAQLFGLDLGYSRVRLVRGEFRCRGFRCGRGSGFRLLLHLVYIGGGGGVLSGRGAPAGRAAGAGAATGAAP